VIPVARIESDRETPPRLSNNQARDAAIEISQLALLPNVLMVQVDFDATTTQRQFYRTLLIELRKRMPPATKLSITALASWCQGDNWLANLPIDEAVADAISHGHRPQRHSFAAVGRWFSDDALRIKRRHLNGRTHRQLAGGVALICFQPE